MLAYVILIGYRFDENNADRVFISIMKISVNKINECNELCQTFN